MFFTAEGAEDTERNDVIARARSARSNLPFGGKVPLACSQGIASLRCAPLAMTTGGSGASPKTSASFAPFAALR